MTKIKKRIISSFLIFTLLLSGVVSKLFIISENTDVYASNNSSTRQRIIAKTRGCIYDRSLKKLVNDETQNVVIIKPTAKALTEILKLENKEEIENTLRQGELYIGEERSGAVSNSENILNTKTVKRYSNKSLCHIIGYLSSDDEGLCGIEKEFDSLLNDYSGTLGAVFKTDALGRVLSSESIEIRDDRYNSSGGVVLTIDRDIQSIVETALINGNITKGAAVVLSVETGEILSVVSLPLYNQESPEESLNDDDSPFLNRAFSPYSVGSVFKVVTASAALENNVSQENYFCKGSTKKSGVTFYCNNKSGHGNLDIEKATAVSCNPYFIDLSVRVGAKEMIKYAKAFGFGTSEELYGASLQSGTIPTEEQLDSDAAIGNFGFGQGVLSATPLQLAVCYNTIARGGEYTSPKLVKGTINGKGELTPFSHNSRKYKAIEEATASEISRYLLYTVNEGTGQSGKSAYFNSCGKTATAETGQTDENGRPVYNTWFVGFFPYEAPKYTVCILKEDGASGSYDDAPIFKEISEKIYFLKECN